MLDNPYTYEAIEHDFTEVLDPRSDFSQRHAFAVRTILHQYMLDTTMLPLEDVEPLLFVENYGELMVPNWRNTSPAIQGVIRLALQDTNARYWDDCN
jgi:hypothetical protein